MEQGLPPSETPFSHLAGVRHTPHACAYCTSFSPSQGGAIMPCWRRVLYSESPLPAGRWALSTSRSARAKNFRKETAEQALGFLKLSCKACGSVFYTRRDSLRREIRQQITRRYCTVISQKRPLKHFHGRSQRVLVFLMVDRITKSIKIGDSRGTENLVHI